MKNKSIVVGITGYKGLLAKRFIKRFSSHKYIKFRGNIKNQNQIASWFKRNRKMNYLLHFAAIVSTKEVDKNKINALKVNYYGTKNLLESLINYNNKLKYFFFASTSHVYAKGNFVLNENSKKVPNNFYGHTKLKSERIISTMLKNKKIKYGIGRIFSFKSFNQDQSYFIPTAFNKLNKKKISATFHFSESIRDFIHIDDVCNAINHMMINKICGTYNICSGYRIKLKDLILKISKLLNYKGKISFKENKKDFLYASNKKLKKTGWKPFYNMNRILYDFRKKN